MALFSYQGSRLALQAVASDDLPIGDVLRM
jgi:hypothetical protein